MARPAAGAGGMRKVVEQASLALFKLDVEFARKVPLYLGNVRVEDKERVDAVLGELGDDALGREALGESCGEWVSAVECKAGRSRQRTLGRRRKHDQVVKLLLAILFQRGLLFPRSLERELEAAVCGVDSPHRSARRMDPSSLP